MILKDNNEILIPEKERHQMLGLAHAENHKGPEGMLHQLRGKVFWPWMSKQVHHMVCKIKHSGRCRSKTLFNTYPGHTLHADYFELNNKDYLIMVDRLTGFSRCEMTPNKGTDVSIKNWGDQYRYPYKVISDTGPAFRQDFIKQLLTFNIKHKTSSA